MTDQTEQQPQDLDFGPGALLKQTRENQGLTLDDVSERLKLTLPILRNIENDDYQGDLPITFYRGYLKNYAELLNLTDVDICANFQGFCKKHNLSSSPSAKLQGLELEKPVTSNNWLFKIVTGLIILALIFAIYYMVVEKQLWKKFVPSSSESQQLNAETQINALVVAEEGANSNSESLGEASTLPLSDETGVEPSDKADDVGSLAFESPQAEVAEQDNSLALGSNQDNTIEPSSISASIGLTFTGDCWVRVVDATGKVLALGIKSGGTSLQLSGKAPYNLTLGKASAVELVYDGEMVDLSNYPDMRAAKLTLGDS